MVRSDPFFPQLMIFPSPFLLKASCPIKRLKVINFYLNPFIFISYDNVFQRLHIHKGFYKDHVSFQVAYMHNNLGDMSLSFLYHRDFLKRAKPLPKNRVARSLLFLSLVGILVNGCNLLSLHHNLKSFL